MERTVRALYLQPQKRPLPRPSVPKEIAMIAPLADYAVHHQPREIGRAHV